MEKKERIDAFGAVALVIFSALLGLNQVLVKLVNAGMHPVTQVGLRSLCAFFPVFLFALVARRKLQVGDGVLLPGLLAGVLFTVEFVMLFVALDYTTVVRASVLFYTMPFWAMLGAHFWIEGERITITRLAGLLLAIAGIVVAFSNKELTTTAQSLQGDVLCILAAICWAGILILARATKLSRASPESQLLYQLGVSAIVLMPLVFMMDLHQINMTSQLWGIFAFQVLVIVSVGFLGWFWILSIYPPASMASFSFLAPVFGVGFGWLILGEEITVNIILALAMVSLGIVLVNRKTGKQ